MREYIPSKRLVLLGLVLQYDTEDTPSFKEHERFAINQERAKVIANDNSYSQSETVEAKIATILIDIRKHNWKPLNEIQYVKIIGNF